MSLRDKNRAGDSFQVDEPVRRALAEWGKERDSDLGRLNLTRNFERLKPEQKRQLIERLAEISLGLLFILERSPEKDSK